MWRSILVFFIFLFLLTFPTLANQDEDEILPFAYVVWNGDENLSDGSYELYLRNALTGESLLEQETEQYDCAYNHYSNSQWLIYSQGGNTHLQQEFFLLDIPSFESQFFARNVIELDWNENLSQFVFVSQASREYTIALYNVTTHQTQPLATFLNYPKNLELHADGTISYFTLNEDSIVYHQWINGEEFIQTFEFNADRISEVLISPNQRFLAVSTIEEHNAEQLHLFEIETQASRTISHVGGSFQWMQSEEQTLFYVNQERDVYFYHVGNINSDLLMGDLNRYPYHWYIWSPDEQYLLVVEYHEGGTYSPSKSLRLFDRESHSYTTIASEINDRAGQVVWLSNSQFIYTRSSRDIYNDPNDIYLYDASTGEQRALTNTPNQDEQFECTWG